ncbi:hypothetical protein [Paenibacillus turicensis]|nr:hypothetical protein [Paenibacillus turicensis]
MLNDVKVLSKPQIRYELPLSKVVQAIKHNNKIENSWNVVQRFLTYCTTANVDHPKWIRLTINGREDREVNELIQAATEAFGTCEQRFDGSYDLSRWQLPQSKLNQVIHFMIKHEPYPQAVRPYIQLRIHYEFYFIEPTLQSKLVEQQDTSCLSIILQRNSSVMPEFWFPFAQVEDLKSYLLKIGPYLPFKKLDTKAFRLVSPNKKNTGNVSRKLNLDDFQL